MSLTLIDSHAHLTCESFAGQEILLVERAVQAGIKSIINICTDAESLNKGIQLSERFPHIYNTASSTPHDSLEECEAFFPMVKDAAEKGLLKAIGETGLDYFYEHAPREVQKKFFIQYLHLALQNKLPVVIHCREAFTDFFQIIDSEYSYQGKHFPGVLHCFTGTLQEAEDVLQRGWYLSLSGIVTFKKSVELKEVARMVPLEQLLIETDSPYLAPQKYRGQTNEPAFVIEVARMIAELKGLSLEAITQATSLNSQKLFNL